MAFIIGSKRPLVAVKTLRSAGVYCFCPSGTIPSDSASILLSLSITTSSSSYACAFTVIINGCFLKESSFKTNSLLVILGLYTTSLSPGLLKTI
jgi:hypothetical protein